MRKEQKVKTAYLVLEDGTVFKGYSMGAAGVTIGEVVFNTCTASYQDLLSDPTYYGQIVAQTYPLVGNRGVDSWAGKSEIRANGYIAREWCKTPTDLRGGVTLDEYLKTRGIIGLCGIDTRKLTRILRDKGYYNGAITDSLDDLDELLKNINAYSIKGAVEEVTIKEPEHISAENELYKMAVLDFGFHRDILEYFRSRGCSITLFPAKTSSDEIMKSGFDGVMISDGPGDPDENPAYIENIQGFCKYHVPIFGFGLGHQMMALATGGTIEKMDQGHRGSNQPVRNLQDGKIMITTQNHGYAVSKDSLSPENAVVIMENVNDKSIEGIRYLSCTAISVQFEPMDGNGFQDTAWIFDWFVDMMKGGKKNA